MKAVLIVFVCILLKSNMLFADLPNDTIPEFKLREIPIFAPYPFNNEKEIDEYERLEEDLRKVYPLVKLVSSEYERVNIEMQFYDKKRQKAYLKWYENYARENYMPMLSGFTVPQGKLFLKLINREIGESPYHLIKSYRNGFRAIFWQGAAFMFRVNLNAKYEPEENPMTEHILRRIKAEDEVSGLFEINPSQTF